MTDPSFLPDLAAGGTLQDLIAPGLLAVFCGLNPGLRAAASGHHFEGHGNRFWRTMHLAGFTERELRPAECGQLLAYGFGLATVVCRPTARASELSKKEYADAWGGLVQRLDRFRPSHVAFLGKDAYAAMIHQKQVRWGRQPQPLCASSVWLLPNPSGRNRSFSLADLVEAYREFRVEITG